MGSNFVFYVARRSHGPKIFPRSIYFYVIHDDVSPLRDVLSDQGP